MKTLRKASLIITAICFCGFLLETFLISHLEEQAAGIAADERYHNSTSHLVAACAESFYDGFMGVLTLSGNVFTVTHREGDFAEQSQVKLAEMNQEYGFDGFLRSVFVAGLILGCAGLVFTRKAVGARKV